jgi:2-polyprenyl-6-methoxyphenol hydroxylase-like FAD-dependent oxidoreductase
MELKNGSKIAIVGGGPAGTFSAIFLLDLAQQIDLNIEVEIFEPRDFTFTGPRGCNMCGGVISESLVQKLASQGIHLPDELLIDTIDAYTLHTDQSSVEIKAPKDEMRIACIFRGAGPKGAENQPPIPWISFDNHLLELALEKGAKHIKERVTGLVKEEGLPKLTWGKDNTQTYDLVVGCLGLNSPAIQLFKDLDFGYQPPKSTKAYVTELYFGDEEVSCLLGHSMHVFILNIPGVKFIALTPKGPYATLIILGDDIDKELVNKVFHAPEMKKCLPVGWEIPVQTCHCQPHINIGAPKNPYTDRIVLVGDCSSSRLYKDGIGAAYRLAKAMAYTATTHGVSTKSFQRFFRPACRKLDWDNRLGHLIFFGDSLMRPVSFFQEAIIEVIREEQTQENVPPRLSTSLWDTFTGSSSYRNIIVRSMHPVVIFKLTWEALKKLFGFS